MHIEQGPSLERSGATIGVVEGNWGTMKYIATFTGAAAHTGPTAMSERRDALLAAGHLIVACRALSDRTGGSLLSSVGRLDVEPNSTNVVAAQVRLYDRLFVVAQPDAGDVDFKSALNPQSMRSVSAWVEPSLATVNAEDRFQFERHGYFVADRYDSKPGALVFNRSVGLKDTAKVR